MISNINLGAYFDRIGYKGQYSATLDTLRTLHEYHPQAIPFENLNPLLGLPVKLDLKSIEQKLVHNKRGGYCFEHNLLFSHVLETLGFSVEKLAARVLWNAPESKVTPRGHMLLLINLDEKKYIADVGFGGSTLTAPVLLDSDIIQETPHEPYRLLDKEEGYILESLVDNEWKALYSFDLQKQFLADYEVTNWYLSNHPDSHFVNDLITARSAPGKRYVLRDNEFKVHYVNGETERKTLKSRNQIREILEDTFQLKLPDVLELDIALDQIIQAEGVSIP